MNDLSLAMQNMDRAEAIGGAGSPLIETRARPKIAVVPATEAQVAPPDPINEGDAAALWWFACQKEARALCPVITPMMHHEVATSVENAKILKEQEARKRKLGRLRV